MGMKTGKQIFGGLLCLFVLAIFLSYTNRAKEFKYQPGFDAQKCEDIFRLNFAFLDTNRANKFEGYLSGYRIFYRSEAVGLDNASDIWLRQDSTVVIMLRGTTEKIESLLEDFYCAMVPAKGTVILSKNKTFDYQLAKDPRAAVHAGFLIGFAYVADAIQPKINELYQNGYRKFLVGGHSQGGSLSYYVSAWLMQQRAAGIFEKIQVKTYASAAPKMGNMYFAYDYDNANLSEWSFSIVNTADPVPEIPLTTQQVDIDMNEPNPILNLMKRIDGLSLLKRIVIKRKVNFTQMRRQAKKSSEAYQKYLGKSIGDFIKMALPEMILPPAVPSTYFVRPGVPIILATNTAYSNFYADAPKYFDHGIDPYRFLLRQYYKGLSPFEPVLKD